MDCGRLRPLGSSLIMMARYAWALPCSAVGLIPALALILMGARFRVRDGVVEVSGGLLGQALACLPAKVGFNAITLGHVILGVNESTLDAVRAHEHVHVRQCERWGLLFFPAYLLSSLAQLMRGRDPYFDNHFEREAYSKAPLARPCADPAAR